ncbi:hypothetical protein CC1G_10504 [Coprinopsis cinerea okayama7|uniref:Uncharacterized protein n=1 Tax=Coprinopsis cinerea (strain Okayama-7 / 130 / ATCC MYA-4618 / FGSC 9003) TaxID=240176 RepID=A8NL73_COPC7|nr:hypothetical protein CC1G_10504 [Coprinopsis cinerea okayama7\|eukprot:XP_001834630.1 hypothetical protein CC1G_10504 [Coprinopsis cinerea okayama7\
MADPTNQTLPTHSYPPPSRIHTTLSRLTHQSHPSSSLPQTQSSGSASRLKATLQTLLTGGRKPLLRWVALLIILSLTLLFVYFNLYGRGEGGKGWGLGEWSSGMGRFEYWESVQEGLGKPKGGVMMVPGRGGGGGTGAGAA